MKTSPAERDAQMRAWQAVRNHQRGDQNCGRDWNSDQGCACAYCRTARLQGIQHKPGTFVICDGYHRRIHAGDYNTHREAEQAIIATGRTDLHIVEKVVPA